jgi:hypothetical protein
MGTGDVADFKTQCDQFLRQLFEMAGGDKNKDVNRRDVGKALGYYEVNGICDSLQPKGCIEPSSAGGFIRITQVGINQIQYDPDELSDKCERFIRHICNMTHRDTNKQINSTVAGDELGFSERKTKDIVAQLKRTGRVVAAGYPKGISISITSAGVTHMVDNAGSQLSTHPDFPTPEGTDWQDVTIAFVSEEDIKITVGNRWKEFHFSEIGFKNAKTGRPNINWEVLKTLLEEKEISKSNMAIDKLIRTAAKKAVQSIRKRLKTLMGIADDPIEFNWKTKAYTPQFSLIDRRDGGRGRQV